MKEKRRKRKKKEKVARSVYRPRPIEIDERRFKKGFSAFVDLPVLLLPTQQLQSPFLLLSFLSLSLLSFLCFRSEKRRRGGWKNGVLLKAKGSRKKL